MIHVNRWWIAVILSIFGAALLRPVYAENIAVARIGEVWLQDKATAAPFHQAFVEGLHELGYIEGKNLMLVTRYANKDESRLPLLFTELIGLHVTVLFVSQGAVGAGKKATTTIPIVCATMNDPVGAGLVKSLSRPDGNLTGLSLQSVDTATKRLELILELRPRPTRLAVLFDGDDRAAQLEVEALKNAARKAQVALATFNVRSRRDLSAASASMASRRPQALYVVDTVRTLSMHREMATLALDLHIPLISEARLYAEAGAVLAYGAKLPASLKRGAVYVHKILEGAKPRELPIEQPTEFELVVNLRSARAVGIQVPESILSRADEVIR